MTIISKDISVVTPTDSGTLVSFEDYMKLYYNAEDGFKYEWNNGKIEKTANMNQAQTAILNLLMRLFIKTKTFQEGGQWNPEVDMWTNKTQFRRPDLSIYHAHQEKGLINEENEIAPWIGEIISPSDNINTVNGKLHEYFAAGVQVVWHIFPSLDEVYVYTAPDEVTICRGNRICSAKPALDDFEISAEDIFVYKKHLKKEA